MNRTRAFPLEDIAIANDGTGRTVEAFAAVFDTPAEVRDQDGHYREQIAQRAFDDALERRRSGDSWRVGVFYNHGMTIHGTPSERASVPLGTPIHIRATTRGLLTVTRYNRTQQADDILESIRNGDITGQSFSGRFLASEGHRRGQKLAPGRDGALQLVTRTAIDLTEYGPTPFPVYADAEITGVRTVSEAVADELGQAATRLRRMAVTWSALRAKIREGANMAKRSEHLAGEMESIRAKLLELDAIEEPTEEQVEQARAALDEFTALEEQHRSALEHEEKMERVRSYAIAHPEVRESGSPDVIVRTKRDPFANVAQIRAGLVPLADMRGAALDAIENNRSEYLTDAQRERATQLAQRNPMIARHILLHGSPEYHEDFYRWIQDPMGYRGTAMTNTDANGGYLTVPYTLDPTIILTNAGSDNPFRRVSRVETIAGTDTWNGVTSAGVDAQWLAEATESAEAGPTFGSVSIPVIKAFAELTASYEVLQDSNFASQLPMLLADAKDRLEADAFAVGSGSTAPKGVVTAVTAVTTSRVTPTTAGSFTSASAADVYKVINALPARHRSRSSWVANFATFNIIRQMDTSGGSAFWANFAGPTNPESLLGLPVLEASAMTSTVTTGSNILLAGNFQEFIIVDRVGMSVSYDPNVRGAGYRHTGQGQYTAFWRTGADCANPAAFRVLKL